MFSLIADYSLEYDLIRAIKIPFEDQKTQFFDKGLDGFPAFGLLPGSDVKVPYRIVLPEKLYPEFTIQATVKLSSQDGGFLFAVVNPLETVVQLGVQITPTLEKSSHSNFSLFYTDANTHFSSEIIASFDVSDVVNKWTR